MGCGQGTRAPRPASVKRVRGPSTRRDHGRVESSRCSHSPSPSPSPSSPSSPSVGPEVAAPSSVGDGAGLEEEAPLRAGERCLLGGVDAAALDGVAAGDGAARVVTAVRSHGHACILRVPSSGHPRRVGDAPRLGWRKFRPVPRTSHVEYRHETCRVRGGEHGPPGRPVTGPGGTAPPRRAARQHHRHRHRRLRRGARGRAGVPGT